jgi:hypothetical protein
MNKKEIAKLLIKHPEIKALYESRAFDASTINKVIAEEIVREEQTPETYAEETEALKVEYDKMIQKIIDSEDDDARKSALDDLKAARSLLSDSMGQIQIAIKQEMEYYDGDVDPELTEFANAYKERRRMMSNAIKKLGEKVDQKTQQVAQSPSPEDDRKLEDTITTAADALTQVTPSETPKDKESIEQELEKSDAAITAIDSALDGIEVVDGDVANASSDGEENAEETAQENTHLDIMKKIFGNDFETDYPILSKDEKFLELLAQAIADKRSSPASGEEKLQESQEDNDARAAEIQRMQAVLDGYGEGSLAGINVADIVKTAQSVKDTSGGVVDLVLDLLADSVADKATETLVTPILDKINMLGDGAAAAQAAASVGTGGASLISAGLTLLAKKVTAEIAQAAGEAAIKVGIRALLNKGFGMIPKANVISKGDQILVKILGQTVWKKIDELVKKGSAKRNEIKTILQDNWEQILSNFIVVSASGELGKSLKEWSVEAVTFEIAGAPIGPFLAKQLGLSDEQIQEINEEAAQMAAAADAIEAQAAEEEAGTDSETTDGTEDGTQPQLPAGKGWDNAKNSVSNVLKQSDMTVDRIKDALSSLDKFKELFKPRSGAEEKFAQAKGLEDYMISRLGEIQAKANDATSKEDLPTEAVENLAATYIGYMDYLNALPQEPQFKEDFQMPETIPSTEEEFKQQFIEPIAPEGATVGTSDEDYIALGKQVISQAGDLLEEFSNNAVVERFLGWYVGERSKEIAGQSPEQLQEVHPDLDSRFEAYSSITTKYDKFNEIKKVVTKDANKWVSIFEKLDELIKNGEISIDAPVSDEPTEIKPVEQLEEEAEQSAAADSELEQATHQDKYKKYIPDMNNFFEAPGRTKLGFMEQFLLKDQSRLLWELIAQLSEIAEIGEERALNRAPEQDRAGVGPDAEQEGSLQEGLMDSFFKRKKEPIALSKEDQVSLKTDVISLLKAIKQMKVYVSNYEENMTRVSVDPALDGSSLEKKIQEYAAPLQQSIAKVVERAYVAHQNQTKTKYMNQEPSGNDEAPQQDQQAEDTPEVTAEARELFEALEGIMLEDEGRQASINTVEQIYNIMRKIYMPEEEPSESTGLQGLLARGERADAMKKAQEMLDTAKKEEFIKLFPGGKFNDKGMPVTVGEASSALSKEIKKLIPIVKDTVMLAQGETIPHGQLLKIFTNLTTVSKTIENYFGVKSLIKEDYQAEIQKFMAEEDEANKAITENPVEPGNESSILGKMGDLAEKGLEKLKQMFSWMSEETHKMLAALQTPAPVFEPMIKAIDLTPKSDEWKNTAIQDVSQAAMWFNTLEKEEQQALTIYGKYLLDNEAIVSEDSAGRNAFYGAMNTAGVRFQDGKGTRKAFKKAYKAVKEKDASMAKAIDNLMTNHKDNLVKFFTFTISNVDLATDLFKLLEELPETSIQPSSKPPESAAPSAPKTDEIDDETEDDDGDDVEKPPSETEGGDNPEDDISDSESEPPPTKEDLEKVEKIIQKYDETSILSSKEATDVLGQLLTPQIAEKTGKDSEKVLGSIVEIAKIYLKDARRRLDDEQQDISESVSKILNKIKTSAKTFMKNQKVKSEFSSFKGDFKKLLSGEGMFEEASPLLIYLLKFMSGSDLRWLLADLKQSNGDIDYAIRTQSDPPKEAGDDDDRYVASPDKFAEALKPIIEKMLKEHYNY